MPAPTHLTLHVQSLTKFVSVPGIIKGIPVLAVEAYIILNGAKFHWTLLASFALSTGSTAFHLHIISQWYQALSDYQMAKLKTDQMLKSMCCVLRRRLC